MEDLAQRVQRLEDLEEIRQLRARYCYLLDDGEWQGLAELFTEDGQFHGIGSATGRAELAAFYARVHAASFDAWWHFSANETVEWHGDHATGETYLYQPCVMNGTAYVSAGRYRDELVKRDGRWYFKVRRVSFFYFVPFDESWRPGRIVPPGARQAAEPVGPHQTPGPAEPDAAEPSDGPS